MTKKAAPSIEERPLPHNLEAERSVLGAILIQNAAFTEIATTLRPEHFYRDAHRRIFAAAAELLEQAGGVCDFITLKEQLAKKGEIDAVGGPAYISALTDGVPRATNIRYYGDIVRQKARLRQVIRTGDTMVRDAYEQELEPDEIIGRADRAILGLRSGLGGRMRSLHDSANELYEDLSWRAEHKGQLIGISSGFASIDELTNGWQKADVIVVAARPSIGKTTWVMNSARAAAGCGYRVAVFSLEMRRKQLEYRLLASESQVDLSKITSGYMAGEEWRRVSDAFGGLNELPIFIDDTARRTLSDIRWELRRLQGEGGIDLAVVDYVQLMSAETDKNAGNRNAEITEISRGFKHLADEFQLPLIVLSQLNRGPESRSDPRPRLVDLRESGALEQDADVVCFLHRKHHKEDGPTQFIVEKQRNGPTGTVMLTVNRSLVTFTDGGEELPPDTPEERKAKQVDFFRQRARRSR